MKITVPVEIEDNEAWSRVFGGGWEYCTWWRRERYLEGDWNVAGAVELEIDDPEGEEGQGGITAILRIDDIAKALSILASTHPHLFADFMDEDMDQFSSDAVLQIAMLGEVVYG